MSNTSMDNAIKGAGSYVALIVMVWYGMSGSPGLMAIAVGVLNGVGFAWLMGIIIPFFITAYRVAMLLVEMHCTPHETLDIHMFDAYMAYICDKTKLPSVS